MLAIGQRELDVTYRNKASSSTSGRIPAAVLVAAAVDCFAVLQQQDSASDQQDWHYCFGIGPVCWQWVSRSPIVQPVRYSSWANYCRLRLNDREGSSRWPPPLALLEIQESAVVPRLNDPPRLLHGLEKDAHRLALRQHREVLVVKHPLGHWHYGGDVPMDVL
jgi:hypothetical protein